MDGFIGRNIFFKFYSKLEKMMVKGLVPKLHTILFFLHAKTHTQENKIKIRNQQYRRSSPVRLTSFMSDSLYISVFFMCKMLVDKKKNLHRFSLALSFIHSYYNDNGLTLFAFNIYSFLFVM